MTEEIIIDGVDVSECKYLNKVVNEEPYCNIDEEHLYTCSSNENCHYKQLKRLEQENKELKTKLSSTKCYLCGEGFLTPEGAELYEEKESYRSALEEIREICKCSKSPMNCDECPQNDDCEELCVNDENLQDIINDKINEVLNP